VAKRNQCWSIQGAFIDRGQSGSANQATNADSHYSGRRKKGRAAARVQGPWIAEGAFAGMAEAGKSSKQIAAMSGHKSLKEIERYTDKADQAKLAEAAMSNFRYIRHSRRNK
jgi:hypothetical protein